MIDCVEAFDAAAAAAAERTVEAKFFLSDSQSSHSSMERTATAAGIPPEWKNSSGVSSNALTSAASLLFPKVAIASSPSPRSPPPTNIPAARSSPAAPSHAAGSKRITSSSLLETAREAPWQRKTKAYGDDAEGKVGTSASCDLSHPVHHLPAAGKPDAGASTATPSVFSPCPSEEAVSPLMEASSCFSPGELTSEDATFPWDAASSTTSSSTQSIRRKGSAADRKRSSREHSRSKTKKAEDARAAVVSSVAAALNSPVTISQQLCTSSGSPPREADRCYFENSAALTAQDCWQQPPPLNQQAAGAASAGGAAIWPGEALAGCRSSSMPCWWDGPAPLEGGRTAATLDYYLGDETCTPATGSCPSTAAFVLEQQQGQRQEIEEAHQREEGREDMLDEQQPLEEQQKTHKQELLLQQVELHRDDNSKWENGVPAEKDGRAAAAAEQDSLPALQVRTVAAAEEEEEDEENEEEEEKAGSPPLLLFPFLRKAKVLKIAINEALLLQQQTSYLLQLQPPSSPTAVPAAFCSSCNGGSSALERTLLFESTKEHLEVADTEGAAAFSEAAAAGDRGTMSLCYTCELALHVNTAQQLLTRTHRALQQLLLQQEEEEARWHEVQQQQQQHPSMTLFLEQMQQQHETAASAAELRIRRSVLRQQQHQLQIALEQQQQLEDDLKARWETEVLADMQILCPDRPQRELQQKLSQQLLATEEQQGNAAAAAWLLVESSNCSTPQSCVPAAAVDAESSTSTTTTAGGGLQTAEVVAAKCRQLQKLQASLLEVRSMMEQMQQLQLGRDEQIGCIEEAATITKQNTSDAVHDLLLARKYQRRAFRHSLYFVGALAALFLFFFFPTSPLVPLLFLFHGEKPQPPQSP